MNTQEIIGLLRLDNISQVYSGKRNCCRCGCGGEYTATSYMDKPRSEVDDALVKSRIKRAVRLLAQGAEYDYHPVFLDVKTGEDRTLTFYFDELKPKTI